MSEMSLTEMDVYWENAKKIYLSDISRIFILLVMLKFLLIIPLLINYIIIRK